MLHIILEQVTHAKLRQIVWIWACPGNSKINLENRAKSFNVIYPTKWHLNCEAAEECMEEVRELMEQNADAIDIFNHCNDRKVCKCYPMFIQM